MSGPISIKAEGARVVLDIGAGRGASGASAYQAWLAAGNAGSVSDFIGDVNYQTWLSVGNVGTKADFLNSMKGAPGPGLNNRDQWVINTTYTSSDYVFADDGAGGQAMYVARGVAGHTFVSTLAPKNDASNWNKLSAPQGPPGTTALTNDWGDGTATDKAPVVALVASKIAAAVAGKVDAAGALSAAVGTDLTQAPSRAQLQAQIGAKIMGWRANNRGTVYPNSTLMTVYDKLSITREITPEEFGAVGDVLGNPGQFSGTNGVNPSPTDDSLALQRMAANVGPNTRIRLSRVYATSQPIVFPNVNWVSIEGEHEYTSGFLYTGTSTTVDILKIGDGSQEMLGWRCSHFIIDSSTRMTAGAALHVTRGIFCTYDNLVFAGQYGILQTAPSQTTSTFHLWNGFYGQGYLSCQMPCPEVTVRNIGIALSGYDVGGGNFYSYGAGFFISGGKKIGGCQTGVLMGGGCFELLLDEVDVIGNISNNLRMSQELYPHSNGILFCKQVKFDTVQAIAGAGASVLIDDPGDSFTQPALMWNGTWVGSGPAQGLYIKRMGTTTFAYAHIVGCRITNHQQGQIRVDSTTAQVLIEDTVVGSGNGAGINATNAGGANGTWRNVRAKNITFLAGASPKFTGNIEGLLCTWTPVFGTDSGGTMSTQPTINYAEYIDEGPLSAKFGSGDTTPIRRKISFNIGIVLPTLGAGLGQVTMTLPWAANAARGNYGAQGVGPTIGPVYGLGTGGNNMRILPYSGGSSAKSGENINLSGWYFADDNGQPA